MAVSGACNLVDVDADLIAETDKAFLLSDGNKVKEWVPKFHVEHNDDGSFTMPAWLAEQKGFV